MSTIHTLNAIQTIMERKISGKIDTYIIDMKDAFSSKIRELGTAASAAAASATETDASATKIS